MNCKMNDPVGPRAIKFFIDKKMGPCLEELGLNASCGPFILGISENEGISLKELSAITMVDKSLTTRTIRVLIDNGFVENISKDSHLYSLKLTDKGLAAASVIRKSLKTIWDYLLKDLTEEEKNSFRSAQEKVNKAIKEDAEREISEGRAHR